jgi:leader peptidase (prepilin peptidase)/N-methyltransferase
MVEALVGLLFSWWLLVGFLFFQLATRPLHLVQPGFWLLTGIILAILTLSDLFYGAVLLPVVSLGYAVTIAYRLILVYFGAYHAPDLILALVSSGVFFGLFWLLYRMTKGRGMGDGDMYVAAYMGLILSWPKGMVALLLSFVIGAVVGVILIATHVRTRKDTLPFVPFMVLSTGIALLWGEQIWRLIYMI